MDFHEGKGTCQVAMPRVSARGWNNQIYIKFEPMYTELPTKNTHSRKLNRKVREKDLLRALPLLLWCRNLVGLKFPLAEIGNRVNDNPGYATTKVNDLKDVGGQQDAPKNTLITLTS